jgi:serine O-acetyltransferase
MKGKVIARRVRMMSGAFVLPLLIPFVLTTQKELILQDVRRWLAALPRDKRLKVSSLLGLLRDYREFRTLYYYRLTQGNRLGAILCVFLRPVFPGQTSLYLACPKIGPGLFLQHAFSTVVAAASIGSNCWINQQVTIGFSDSTAGPVLGDNVVVSAGAKVIGPIHVGNNVTIGANAVVVKDVPDDCVVVGVPAYIVRRRGVKVMEQLGKQT